MERPPAIATATAKPPAASAYSDFSSMDSRPATTGIGGAYAPATVELQAPGYASLSADDASYLLRAFGAAKAYALPDGTRRAAHAFERLALQSWTTPRGLLCLR